MSAGDKVLDWSQARERCLGWKADRRKIVFTNGCFDILHPGHVDLLEKARALGDVLVVGLNDDDSVRRLKGPSRPVNEAADRAFVLGGLQAVDAVVVFEEDTPLALIEWLVPNVLVKGGDYSEATIVGAPFVRAHGGDVVVVPLVEGKATTAVVERIRSERGSTPAASTR